MSGQRWERWAAVGLVVVGLVSSLGSLEGAFSLETEGYEAIEVKNAEANRVPIELRDVGDDGIGFEGSSEPGEGTTVNGVVLVPETAAV